MINVLVEMILFVVFMIGLVSVSKKTGGNLGIMFAFFVSYVAITELGLSLIR